MQTIHTQKKKKKKTQTILSFTFTIKKYQILILKGKYLFLSKKVDMTIIWFSKNEKGNMYLSPLIIECDIVFFGLI